MTEVNYWQERLDAFLASEIEDDRLMYQAKLNELIENGFNPRQAYINLHRNIVEPLLDQKDIAWEDYTEATAKEMHRPTLADVNVWIELASKIGPAAATGNWQAVEHEFKFALDDLD